MDQFGLLLMQGSAFKGLIVGTPNPPPNPGIWYFSQGTARPPFPVSVAQGVLMQAQGPAVLIQDQPGNLLAVMWELDYATAVVGATGPFASPAVNGSWEFVPAGSEKLVREHPELASQLRK